MSNPLVARTQAITNDRFSEIMKRHGFSMVFQDGVYSGRDGGGVEGLIAAAGAAGARDAVLSWLEKKECVLLRPSLQLAPLARAGLVFNEGACRRPLAITADAPIQFRRRTLLATMVRNAILEMLNADRVWIDPVWGDFLGSSQQTGVALDVNFPEVYERTRTHFMVSGGTQYSLGRLRAALPEPLITRLTPITAAEADAAYYNCGFLLGSRWELAFPSWSQYFREPWPIGQGDGRVVTINMDASLGIPYYARGKDKAALRACLEVLKNMETSGWRTDAAKMYRLAMKNRPGLVTFLGKTKSDIYSSAKIDDLKLRFYLVMPGHLKLFVQRATQPFSEARVTLQDAMKGCLNRDVHPNIVGDEMARTVADGLFHLRSAQKMGLSGGGADIIVRALDMQLSRNGYAYLHCGDDTIAAIWVWRESRQDDGSNVLKPCLTVFGVDQSNFDLTQRSEVMSAIDDRLAKGLSLVDANVAALWREIRQGRLVNIHQAGMVYMEGLGTSGMPLQSEVNGMIEDVYMQRLMKRLTLRSRVMNNSIPAFHTTADDIRNAVRSIGEGMGLDARLEFIRSTMNETVLFPDARCAGHLCLRRAICSEELSFTFLGYHFTGAGVRALSVVEAWPPRVQWSGTYSDGSDIFANPFDVYPLSVVPDMGRFCTNLLYATQTWIVGDKEHRIYDVLRLVGSLLQSGALFLSTGANVARTFGVIQEMLLAEIEDIDNSYPVRWEVNENAFASTNEALGELKSTRQLRSLIKDLRAKILSIWSPFHVSTKSKILRLRAANVPEPPPQATPLGLSWADQMDEDDARAVGLFDVTGADDEFKQILSQLREISMSGEPVFPLRVLTLRAVTRENWARPPPSAVVRFPQTLDPVGKTAALRAVEGGKSKTKRRNATKRRARARARGEDRETEEHFDALHEEEDRRRAEEAAWNEERRQQRLEEAAERRAEMARAADGGW